MREPYTQLYIHLVWATWDRLPLITSEVERMVYGNIQAKCADLGAALVSIGGTENHVHVLVRLPATISVADLVKHLKGASSHLVTHRAPSPTPFKWQGGYGAFTLGKEQVEACRRYIARQREHHDGVFAELDTELCGGGDTRD